MEKIKKIIFTSTGEYRLPKMGEYYVSDTNTYLAEFDFTQESYDIYTREEFEEQWKPKINELYYCIQDLLGIPSVYSSYFKNDNIDTKRIEVGNCFRTRESTESRLKEIKEILLK